MPGEQPPDDIIFDHFQEVAYPLQSLGRPILGTEEGIREMPRTTLTGYMKRHYAPPNVVVAAAGKLEHAQILDLVQRHFADLPAQVPPGMENGVYQGGEFREDRDLDQVHICLGFPSVGYSDPDYYPTLLLSTVLGGGMSSRLFQEIREKRGLVYSIYSFAQPYMDGGLFGIYAGTGESEAEELDAGHAGGTAQGADLRRATPNCARAKAQVKASVLMSLESTGSRCEQLARQIQVFGRVLTTDETVQKIMAVTPADVQRAAVRHFRGKPTLAAMGPAEPGCPGAWGRSPGRSPGVSLQVGAILQAP